MSPGRRRRRGDLNAKWIVKNTQRLGRTVPTVERTARDATAALRWIRSRQAPIVTGQVRNRCLRLSQPARRSVPRELGRPLLFDLELCLRKSQSSEESRLSRSRSIGTGAWVVAGGCIGCLAGPGEFNCRQAKDICPASERRPATRQLN